MSCTSCRPDGKTCTFRPVGATVAVSLGSIGSATLRNVRTPDVVEFGMSRFRGAGTPACWVETHLDPLGERHPPSRSAEMSLGAEDTSVCATSWLRSISPNYPKSPAFRRVSWPRVAWQGWRGACTGKGCSGLKAATEGQHARSPRVAARFIPVLAPAVAIGNLKNERPLKGNGKDHRY